MNHKDISVLVCPYCHGNLNLQGGSGIGEIDNGRLACIPCVREWAVTAGLPRLIDETEVHGLDRLMRFTYDWLGRFHDPAVELLLPLLQCEGIDRNNYIRRLELAELVKARKQKRRRPIRILEVGIGGGANIPLIEAAVPVGVDFELWGVDLSEGMLAQCQRRLGATPTRQPVRLAVADAHTLPFADASFDRVFHVGGLNAYNDPRRGLAEMARVACPGTPIVVVDEQLDPHRRHPWFPWLVFHAATLVGPAAVSPRALLPLEATEVLDEQASRFYYCLTFRMPAGAQRTS